MKHRIYAGVYANIYFWRTYSQQEIDLVEEREGRLIGYEAKWSARKSVQAPGLWTDTYANAEYQVVTPENYLDFVV